MVSFCESFRRFCSAHHAMVVGLAIVAVRHGHVQQSIQSLQDGSLVNFTKDATKKNASWVSWSERLLVTAGCGWQN